MSRIKSSADSIAGIVGYLGIVSNQLVRVVAIFHLKGNGNQACMSIAVNEPYRIGKLATIAWIALIPAHYVRPDQLGSGVRNIRCNE